MDNIITTYISLVYAPRTDHAEEELAAADELVRHSNSCIDDESDDAEEVEEEEEEEDGDEGDGQSIIDTDAEEVYAEDDEEGAGGRRNYLIKTNAHDTHTYTDW